MNDLRDLMYDMILESLVNKVDDGEITMQEASIFSEAAYDEIYTENLEDYKSPSQIDEMKPGVTKLLEKAKHWYHLHIDVPKAIKKELRDMSTEEVKSISHDCKTAISVLNVAENEGDRAGDKKIQGITSSKDYAECKKILMRYSAMASKEYQRRTKK